MDVAEELRAARAAAQLTQRELSARTGVAQPTIARIELGLVDPRLATLQRLLGACGRTLTAAPLAGFGIDRTQIRAMLRLSPLERVRLLRDDAAGLRRLEAARR
jgi:transcriptional regulator with XRE-family HTH domain